MSKIDATLPMSSGELADGARTRVLAAGIDPERYAMVTAELGSADDWPAVLRAAAAEHAEIARRAETDGHDRSAGEAYLDAARWSHFATTVPHPDRAGHAAAVAESADWYVRALKHLEPTAERTELPDATHPLVGILRRPDGNPRPPVVLVIGGLDSSKEEFHYVADALLARGMATFALDGPGQGELSASSSMVPDYERVAARAIDALAARDDVDAERVGAIALSLGGYFGVRAAAYEPRVRALVTVTGVDALDLEALPGWVADTVAQRAGGADAARAFARQVDSGAHASRVAASTLVVGATDDPLVPEAGSRKLAETIPNGEALIVPGADHLGANRRWRWLPDAADWLTTNLR